FRAEDGIRDRNVTGVQTCALPISNQFVLPQSFINPAEQASDQKAFDNITGKGRSVSRVNEEMSANSSKTPYFEHIKMLIISEELAKQEGTLINLLDHY